MNVLTSEWAGGYLDYTPLDGELRIDVHGWIEVAPVPEQFFVRPKDWRILVNYVAEIGVRGVITKVRSRLAEAGRNEKRVSVGVGRVRGGARDGEAVSFVAYNHPRCASRVALPESLVGPWAGALPEPVAFVAAEAGGRDLADDVLMGWAGWSPFSGEPAPAAGPWLAAAAPRVEGLLAEAERLGTPEPEVRERGGGGPPAGGRLSAALFGLGNYAKTVVLPSLDDRVVIGAIHEVDPTQIGPVDVGDVAYDTSPTPRPGDRYDVYFAAGYHHTHAPLAAHAVAQGAAAVLEKPLATTPDQLRSLEASVRDGRVFGCFHKRYSSFNDLALADLDVSPGGAVTYHAIVYEVPLPERHWYRWPASGSRLLSNGCHWIDHFLFLNGYAEVVSRGLATASNGDVYVTLELANGAAFSMTLTDVGSPRTGVRETVELRAGDRTVRIVDATRYHAEDGRRVLRRKRLSRMDSYRRMYREISRAVAEGDAGDTLLSLRSTAVVLELEADLQARLSPAPTPS